MATTLVVRFVLGRYHATPWARHVNEGQVELPPSPWRLLRALYAVWKTRVPDLDECTAVALLSSLAAPPTYFVPPYQVAHTRHYFPDSTSRSGRLSVDRTLDAFAVIDRQAEIGIRWPESIPAEQRKALDRLAASLPYLGRADSICEARVDDLWEPSADHATCGPFDVGESVPSDTAAVTLLAPTLPLDLGALVLRPVDVRAKKLLFPRSTRFVGYAKPAERRPASPRRRRHKTSVVQAVRFTVTARVRPAETDAVVLTDRLRLAALSHLNRLRSQVPGDSMLAGRLADQTRMTEHRHAHYLALPGADRLIEDLAVWVSGGLPEDELEALSRVRQLRAPREGMPGTGPVDVRMSAYGAVESVLYDLTGPSRTWHSVTPFVPSRHPKRDWAAFLEREIRRELAHRGILEPVTVSIDDRGWREFARDRPTKRFATRTTQSPEARPGAFLTLTSDRPLAGPLALGHLSHFGLGLFVPTR